MSGEQTVVIVDQAQGVDGGKPPGKGRKPPTGYQKKERLKSVKAQPSDFIGKFELAHHLQCNVNSLRAWIADGTVPPPHSRPGEKHPVWLREHYEEFKRTGKWPRAAWERRA